LIYNNLFQDLPIPKSRLEIYDFKTNKLVWSFENENLSSDICGGVQLLDDGSFVYSDINDGGKVFHYSKEKILLEEFSFKNFRPGSYLQQAKLLDMDSFLSKNTGP
jgi:hypothetical protein